MSKSGIKIFAPACLSLYSYGLKNLSICLSNPGNEIKAHIDNDIEDKIKFILYSKEKNDSSNSKEIIKKIATAFLKQFNKKENIVLEITNRIPFDAGLGFLEANITGTILALNNLLKLHLEKKMIFNFIIKHTNSLKINILPSHVAADLYGGIILFNENISNPFQKIYNPHGISLTLIPTKSKSAFKNLSSESWLDQTVSITTLIKGLMTDDTELISAGINNNHFENHLSDQIHFYSKIKEISLKNKVYAIGLAHLGEIIFIVNPNTLIKEQNDMEIKDYLQKNNLNIQLINSEINLNGLYTH